MEHPSISIVTPVRDGAAHLETTISSVLDQGYPDLEYVVVDGGSTDGSVDIIKGHEDRLAYWISEPDRGQYDALNKGFAKTGGEVMGYLNADDVLLPGALFLVGEVFRTFPEIEWLSGAHTAIRELGHPISVIPPARWSRWHLLSERMERFLPQESTFWRRSLWERAGGRFDERYRLAGDFELWARFSRYAVPAVIDAPIGCFRFVEGQRSVTQRDRYLREVAEIRRRERARSGTDERMARLASRMLSVTRPGGRLRDAVDGALGASPVLRYRHEIGDLKKVGGGDLSVMGGKAIRVLTGIERPEITGPKLAKLGQDVGRLAAHRLGFRGKETSAEQSARGIAVAIDEIRTATRERLADYEVGARLAYRETGFHGDRIYQGMIDELIERVPAGSFVETGTALGDSAGYVASRHRRLPVRSCDIDREILGRASRRLWRLPNVRLARASSERFVHTLLERGGLRRPLFFLDAHWEVYWPLGDELEAISGSGIEAVVVVDDFRVPGREDFGFDTWETPSGQEAACDLDLVARHLRPGNDYRMLVPDYRAEDAFPPEVPVLLRGHLVVFQNLPEAHDRLVEGDGAMARHYRPVLHAFPPEP